MQSLDGYNSARVLSKEKEYLAYIREHIDNVNKAYKELLDIVMDNGITYGGNWIQSTLLRMADNIKNHDNSKYSDEEFDAYRAYFHSVDEEEKLNSKEEFEKAWIHHYTVNEHHPEHWVENGIPKDMTEMALLEMACDRIAMSMKFGNDPLDYFNNELLRNKYVMSKSSIDKFRIILTIYNNYRKR